MADWDMGALHPPGLRVGPIVDELYLVIGHLVRVSVRVRVGVRVRVKVRVEVGVRVREGGHRYAVPVLHGIVSGQVLGAWSG